MFKIHLKFTLITGYERDSQTLALRFIGILAKLFMDNKVKNLFFLKT